MARTNRNVGNQKIGDNDRRKIGGGFYLARIKGVKTIDAAKIKIAVAAFEAGVAVKFIALQAVGRIEIFNLVGAGIETGEAAVGAKPDVAIIILEDAIIDGGRQAIGFAVARKGEGGWVEAAETTAVGANPDAAGVIDENADYEIIAEGMRIERVVAELEGFAGRGVVADEAITEAGNPEKRLARAGAVFGYGENAAGEKWVRGEGEGGGDIERDVG